MPKRLARLPDVFFANDRYPGKIMGAHEHGINVQDLRARRFIVGVDQAHQGISEEWRKLAASGLELCRSVGLLDHLHQVGMDLKARVPLPDHIRRPFVSLAFREDGPREFELAQASRQGKHLFASRRSVGHGAQAIAKLQQGIEGGEPLVVHDRAHTIGHLSPNPDCLRALLRRSSQHVDDLVL